MLLIQTTKIISLIILLREITFLKNQNRFVQWSWIKIRIENCREFHSIENDIISYYDCLLGYDIWNCYKIFILIQNILSWLYKIKNFYMLEVFLIQTESKSCTNFPSIHKLIQLYTIITTIISEDKTLERDLLLLYLLQKERKIVTIKT